MRIRTGGWLLVVPAAMMVAATMLAGCGSPAASLAPCTPVPPIASPHDGSPGAARLVATAARNALRDRVSVTETFSEAVFLGAACTPMSGSGTFGVTGEQGQLSVAPGHSQGRSYQLLFVPSGVYVRLPADQARMLPAGRNWVDAPFSSVRDKKYQEEVRAFFAQVLNADPRLALEELAGGATVASPGTPVPGGGTGYAVSLSLTAAATGLTGAGGRVLAAVLANLVPLAGTTTTVSTAPPNPWLPPATPVSAGSATMEVVLDPAGRLNQVSWVPPGAGLGRVTMVFGLGDGILAVQAPGVGAQVELSSVAKAFGGEGHEGGEPGGG